MKRKLLLIILFCLSLLLCILLINNVIKDDFYKSDDSSLNISVIISTSDYSGIFHESVVIKSKEKMKVKKSDGTEIVPKNESYVINVENMSVGESFTISSSNNTKLKIENITRAYGVPEYYGTLDIRRENDGFVIINTLPLEEYLRYVVPSEMPSDYGLEALKAQAVCARNFAIQNILSPAYPQYNACLDDSIRFQVYNNQTSNSITDKAIKETENKVLKYEDNVISTYYFSTSCGHTTDLSLWSGEASPYYQSLLLASNRTYADLCTEEKFKDFLDNYTDAYEADEPWYRWNYYISLEDILMNIDNYLDFSVNNIDKIEIASRRAGGSVSCLKIYSGEKVFELYKESEIRNIFVPFNSVINRNDGGSINAYTKCPSSYYRLEAVYDGNELNGYTLYGGGCGHGLGMSQNCAKELAKEGKKYNEILEYFYIGTNVVEYN